MGEAMLRAKAPPSVRRVFSAGVGALVGRGAEPDAVALMAERHVDISSHRAQQVTDAVVAESELILAMDGGHLRWLHQNYPQLRGRAYLWLHWDGGGDVADPYGLPRSAFAQSLSQIEDGLSSWLRRLD